LNSDSFKYNSFLEGSILPGAPAFNSANEYLTPVDAKPTDAAVTRSGTAAEEADEDEDEDDDEEEEGVILPSFLRYGSEKSDAFEVSHPKK